MSRYYTTIALFAFVIYSCEKIEPTLDNPIDPDNPDYIIPTVNIISGPSEGETVDASEVSFSWTGNDQTVEYRTRIDNDDWSAWLPGTSKTISYLDEGEHTFFVQSRYSTEVASEVDSIHFTVDAVHGPALLFFPRRHMAAIGDIVTFQILGEEVENLAGVQFGINYQSSLVEIVSVQEGTAFSEMGQSIFHIETDNSNGLLDALIISLGGTTASFSGTKVLLVINVRVKTTGSATFSYSGSEIFKDPNNNNIDISEKIGGIINVP